MLKLLGVNLNVGGFQGIRKGLRMQWCKVLESMQQSKKGNLNRITAAPAITSNANLAVLPSSSSSWLPCYTHPLPYLLLWLGTYCFKLNFWTIVQLNIPSFEKSILGASRCKIPILTCYLLPFSSGLALSLFSFIFNYFHDFLDFLKHEQTP